MLLDGSDRPFGVEAFHHHDGAAREQALPCGDERAGVVERTGHERRAGLKNELGILFPYMGIKVDPAKELSAGRLLHLFYQPN